ncbi:MAG: TIGR04255 family protein [Acidimicrobiales bacterium]
MIETPFGDPVASVALRPPSLVFVVAQIRFPLVVSINEERFVGPFQEMIRADYPELERATEAQVLLGHDGVQKVEGGVVWKFSAAPDDWQVALTPSFVALSTAKYTSRDDFLRRLDTLLERTEQWLKPRRVTRFGVRYVDRIDGKKLDRLTEFVRPEVLGPTAVDLGKGGSLRHTITECSYELQNDNGLRARWGRLPAGASLDPSVPPVKSASWVLDLDASVENIEFNRAELMKRASTFGDVIYRYYRWAVTSDFLRAHGGKV